MAVGGRVCTAVSGSVNRRMHMVVSSWHQPATNHICEESDSAKRLFQWTGSHGGQASRVESAEDHTHSCRMVSSTPVLVGLVCGKLAKSTPYTWLGMLVNAGRGGCPRTSGVSWGTKSDQHEKNDFVKCEAPNRFARAAVRGSGQPRPGVVTSLQGEVCAGGGRRTA